MRKAQFFRMEEKPIEIFYRASDNRIRNRIVSTLVVQIVPNNGMIDRREVNAYLMRAAGLDLNIEECKFFETLPDTPQCQSVSSHF